MLLAMDIGNTNVKVGLFDGDTFISSWRVSTLASRTADEFGMLLFDLLATKGVKFDDITGVIISSVAPSLNYTIEHMCSYYITRCPIMTVDSQIDSGVKIQYKNPEEIGSDRIVDAAAANSIYGGPVIVVDFGSATTFNVIDKDGNLLGGAIAPGIKTATESLVHTAAKLPRIELIPPKKVIGKTTVENMQAGIVFGFTGLVDFIVKKIKAEAGFVDAKVIATGGLSELIESSGGSVIDITDRALALKGLKIIYDRNKR
jgi:type III pantothenate kinase